MSENALRRADEVGTSSRLGSQSDDDGGGVGQSDAGSDGGPSRPKKRSMAVCLPNSSAAKIPLMKVN